MFFWTTPLVNICMQPTPSKVVSIEKTHISVPPHICNTMINDHCLFEVFINDSRQTVDKTKNFQHAEVGDRRSWSYSFVVEPILNPGLEIKLQLACILACICIPEYCGLWKLNMIFSTLCCLLIICSVCELSSHSTSSFYRGRNWTGRQGHAYLQSSENMRANTAIWC